MRGLSHCSLDAWSLDQNIYPKRDKDAAKLFFCTRFVLFRSSLLGLFTSALLSGSHVTFSTCFPMVTGSILKPQQNSPWFVEIFQSTWGRDIAKDVQKFYAQHTRNLNSGVNARDVMLAKCAS